MAALRGALPLWAAEEMGARRAIGLNVLDRLAVPPAPPRAAAAPAQPGARSNRHRAFRASRAAALRRPLVARAHLRLDRVGRARRDSGHDFDYNVGAMAVYRIYRMKETAQQQFRWAPHVGGCASVKPKDYEQRGEVEALHEYDAWRALRDSGTPLLVGDLLEMRKRIIADLQICRIRTGAVGASGDETYGGVRARTQPANLPSREDSYA